MEVRARLSIEVYVDCPHCDSLVDLINPDDTNEEDLNEEGYVLNQACPDGFWSERHESFEVTEVTCTKCKGKFDVKGLDW